MIDEYDEEDSTIGIMNKYWELKRRHNSAHRDGPTREVQNLKRAAERVEKYYLDEKYHQNVEKLYMDAKHRAASGWETFASHLFLNEKETREIESRLEYERAKAAWQIDRERWEQKLFDMLMVLEEAKASNGPLPLEFAIDKIAEEIGKTFPPFAPSP